MMSEREGDRGAALFLRTHDGRRLFKMKGPRKPKHWEHIMLVAMQPYENLYSHEMKNSHAECAYCLECKCDLTYKTSQTSAIGRHMAQFHPREKKKKRKNSHQRSSIADVFQDSSSESCDSSNEENSASNSESLLPEVSKDDEQQFLSLLARWLAASHRPFSLVEDEGFLDLMQFVASDLGGFKLKVPGRTTVSRAVGKQAERIRALLKLKVKNTCDFFSLTTDAWTDRAMRSFMALTLHYVDENFSMKDYVLEVAPFDGKHTAEAIKTQLDAAMESWGLKKEKCLKLVRDGASNVTKGAELLDVPHMSCLAHSLHLVVAGALIRKKGKLADRHIVDLLNKEDEEERLARAAREKETAAAVAAATSTVQNAPVVLEPGMDTSNGISTQPAQRSSGVSTAGRDPVADDEVQEESILDGSMTSAWNEVRDLACDEIEKHVEDSCLDEDDLAALQYTRDVVQIFRSLAVYFRKSAKAKHRLLELRKKFQPKVKSFFSLDCPTRWNSCLAMLSRFSDLKLTVTEFFTFLESKEGKKEFGKTNLQRPREEHWFVLRCMMKLLEQFDAVTNLISGGEYPTQAIAAPALRHIRRDLQRVDIFKEEEKAVENYIFAADTLVKMHKVRRTILALFHNRFLAEENDLKWTSYLDPRLTDMEHMDPDEVNQARQNLIDEAIKVYTQSAASHHPKIVQRREPAPEDTTPIKAARKARAGVFGSRATTIDEPPPPPLNAPSDPHQACWSEFRAYLEVAKKVSADANSLRWWRDNAADFPTLAVLARRWLGCVATSVPSERAFSTAGRVVSVHRCSLKPSNVRDSVFISCLLKSKRAKDEKKKREMNDKKQAATKKKKPRRKSAGIEDSVSV